MQAIRISLYILVLILSNYIVFYFGQIGLIITASLLIPFDFVIRCYFHEKWKGKKLIRNLSLLIFVASTLTFLTNQETLNISLASMIGFISAQITAGITYQMLIKKNYLYKVNCSDLVGIMFDSLIFQYIAFGVINPYISISQIFFKFFGGLFWYWIIFVKIKLIK